MIQAEHLRLNNYFSFRGSIYQVTALGNGNIKGHQVDYSAPNEVFSPKEIEPVTLTEEILIKCGFVKDDYSGYGGFTISISEDEAIRIKFDTIIGYVWPLFGNTPVKTEYLHQLQNLYFCLVGTELEIEL